MALTFVQMSFKVTWTIVSHFPLNISEIVRERLGSKWPLYRKWHGESNGHVTVQGKYPGVYFWEYLGLHFLPTGVGLLVILVRIFSKFRAISQIGL